VGAPAVAVRYGEKYVQSPRDPGVVTDPLLDENAPTQAQRPVFGLHVPMREHSTSSLVPVWVSVRVKAVYVRDVRVAVSSGTSPYSVKNSMFTELLERRR